MNYQGGDHYTTDWGLHGCYIQSMCVGMGCGLGLTLAPVCDAQLHVACGAVYVLSLYL